jgi:hypothetical protein
MPNGSPEQARDGELHDRPQLGKLVLTGVPVSAIREAGSARTARAYAVPWFLIICGLTSPWKRRSSTRCEAAHLPEDAGFVQGRPPEVSACGFGPMRAGLISLRG